MMGKPKIRFKGYNEDWEQRKLGEVVEFFNGDRSSRYPNDSDMVPEGIPFINAGDLVSGRVKLDTANKITEEKYNELSGAKIQRGDIIYCLRGTLGKNAFVDNFDAGTVASSLVDIRPKKIVGKYLFQVLNSDIEYRQRTVNDEGAAQPNLSAKNLSLFDIPMPSEFEQEKIALYFDTLDHLITLHHHEEFCTENVLIYIEINITIQIKEDIMAEQVKKPLKITETVLRDAHQSLIATRMTTEQMLPIVDKMDQVGFHAVECWGGATFDASLRFLKEDPWERLRKLRAGFKNTKLQMLFRGQNILGYNHYADDVVEYFVQKSIANGIDIIRIFDCLNDMRNLETAVKAANKENGHAQIALSYTLGDAYTLDYWKDMAKKIEDLGAKSLCIKDMAGLLTPYKATELVTALKESVDIPIDLHTHYTSGVASMTYLKAVEAGCDIIDTAMSPFALGTSQPATEVMVETFRGTPYDTGLDQNLLSEIAEYFRPMREEALESGLMNTKVLGVNIKTLMYQVPGGMLSNLVSQLKEMGQEDKYEAVLEEVPRVRKDFGEPPLVTPSSQIVGTQAVLNVVSGERYKMVTKESKKLLSGEFGQTVKPFNPEVQKKCIGDTKPITCRPADLIEPQLKKLEAEMSQWKEQDEDVLSYALFPQVAVDFFKYREAQRTKVDATLADKENQTYPV